MRLVHERDGIPVSRLCGSYGVSRQAYYSYGQRQHQQDKLEAVILELVAQRRAELPFEGVRKLMYWLIPRLKEQGLYVGRDRLYGLLRDKGLLVRRKRRRAVTTDSRHPFRIYHNLTEGLQLTGSHQLWVADITYLRTAQRFVYLALITDACSRKIVGYDVSDSLELQGCCRALDMALKQLPTGCQPIHHSDRGIQYCSYAYTGKLKQRGIAISMAEKGNCYQNALAERVNGILKEEFRLDHCFASREQAVAVTRKAIRDYNAIRLHLNLNFKTPEQVHKNPIKLI